MWLPCQTAVARSRYFSVAPSIREMTSTDRLLTTCTMPVVEIDTGAGRRALARLPSGATMRNGRVMPSFHGMSQASSGNTGANIAPQLAQYELLTPNGSCGSVPVKS